MKSWTKAIGIAMMAVSLMNASEGSCGGGTTPTPTQPKNKYPIVFVHGFGGFDFLAGIPYFYGVENLLKAQGYQVFMTEESSFNSVEVRAKQLSTQVEKILAITGAKKVHLVGHSMGGLDIRYAATLLLGKDKVASVTSIAAPHHGTKIADLAWEAVRFGKYTPVLNAFISSIGGTITNGRIDLPQDVVTALWNLTSDFTDGGGTNTGAAFNEIVKDLPGVPYFSYAGVTTFHLTLDPADILLAGTSVIFLPEKSDGMVEQSSTHWGTVVSDKLPANHLDETNHLLGDSGEFDAAGFYTSLASKLATTEASFSTLIASK
ncbi:MAG: triacylglycerol lipase [Nitrospirae bacterium]|nr:triacylglycerol lipase [Nitrospirota bacterium]